jgi:hypothetical protein
MKTHPYEWLLPEYPRIPHLIKPGRLLDDDIVIDPVALDNVLDYELIVEEKLDGSNCGMAYSEDGIGLIRNRKHILSKNFTQQKRTPAKEQFLSAWGWQSKNKDKFMRMNKLANDHMSVYGEWVLALHGVEYNQLPTQFIAYAVYSSLRHSFLPVEEARDLLFTSGFEVARQLHSGKIDLDNLIKLANAQSSYSSSHQREGVVIKVLSTTNQYKLIRKDYMQNAAWDDKQMRKQPSWVK